ncbi:UDP-glucose 4-epimerase [Myxococcaceae bacterium]|nr:UDP-glucose 4-epimerase [Myxococcaceae bacterium]
MVSEGGVSAPTSIAITGLGSFFGRRLAQRLLELPRPPKIVGIDLRRPWRLEGRIGFHRVDLGDPAAGGKLAEVLVRERVERVVHAAFRRDPTPDVEADHELETVGSIHVMNACAAAKVDHLVWLSSTMLYGARPDNPNFLGEEHPLRGHADAHCVRNRVEAEELLARFRVKHRDLHVSALRFAWVMGPEFEDRVVRHFASPVVTTLLGYDPLVQFVHEEDALDVLERCVLEDHPGTYNVVGPGVLPLSTLLALGGKRALPLPTPLLYRLEHWLSQSRYGDLPAGFYDYLRWLFVADGARGWDRFGEPVYSSREAWISFVSSRRMRRYR